MSIGLDFVKSVDKNWKDHVKPIDENLDDIKFFIDKKYYIDEDLIDTIMKLKNEKKIK